MHLLISAHDVYPDPGSGGTGRYVHETAARLADRDHDVSVLARRRGDVPARETVAGVRVARYDLSVAGESAPTVAAQLPDATRTVRDHLAALPAPDLVSFQGTVTDALVDPLVDDAVPRSATFHSPWATEYRIRARHESDISAPRRRLNAALRRWIEHRTLRHCDHATALSEFMVGKLREIHEGGGGGNLPTPRVVPGGVDAERYRPDAGVYEPMVAGERRDRAPAVEADGGRAGGSDKGSVPDGGRAGGSDKGSVPDGGRADDGAGSRQVTDGADGDDALAFLTVRRLSPRMGHGMLLRAFARVVRGWTAEPGAPDSGPDALDSGPGAPDAHLYVAGAGPLRERLERRAHELGIADRVTFLGYVPDDELPRAYATADCFVLPTRKLEGFGLATLEALASGTPVVATPVGGTTEILAGLEGDARAPTEMVTDAVTAGALADRMAAWAALAPRERAVAGRACREHARENFTWKRTVDALETEYEALC